ncbi:hypothetical protein EG329_000646 [Mollisiaceae sp. DMI_Dod_QoI]|nr:hypothetical protein EG329_000646 [Helotiales sp. DMI_Dod_QoI]
MEIPSFKRIAGAVFGAFSIISAFKDAIDLFALFTTSRDLGRDYIILLTKLDIEKFILLQWAEQVRLLNHDDDVFDDKRLNHPTVQESIAQILSCIALLLSDASQLKKRYGLKDVSKEQDTRMDLINVERDTPTMSSPCMVRFQQQFRRLKVEVIQHDETTSVWRKARWVIQDKQKFEDLITELAHFTSKLKELVPPIANFRTRGVELTNTKDLEDIHDLKNLKIIFEASTGHRGAIAGSTQGLIDDRCKARILQTLWFRKMTDRREDITAAHQKTLKWAFQPPKEKNTWDDLSDWLRTGAGVYWISGKAGSGKSTLMKYLYSSQNTQTLLSEWTDGKECTIADFFFWYLGTPEQNTQEGLSRALLYQILSRHPELIARALPTMWKEANEVQEDITPPSTAETKYAFEVLSTSRELSPFCFFIDGVDEYVGNYKDGIALINRLAINPHVKIIASSRPIPQCVAEFEDLPMLELQELTRGDISAYVQDIIGNNAYMC